MTEVTEAPADTLAKLMGVKEFLERYPQIWPNRDAFYFAHHRREENGMAKYKVTLKRGQRVLINPDNVMTWLENEGK